MHFNWEHLKNQQLKIMFSSKEQNEKYKSLKSFINESEYKQIHSKPLVPLNIKINVDEFKNEIMQFDDKFIGWNPNFNGNIFAVPYVNLTGNFEKKDPTIGSSFRWNRINPNNPIIDTDCRKHCETTNMKSLIPLQIFKDYYCRSSILRWKPGGEFESHVDTTIPSPWLRLWGTTDEKIKIRFVVENKLKKINIEIEPGRIYLMDTSIVHDGKWESSNSEDVYQFFLSVVPECYDLIKQNIITQ